MDCVCVCVPSIYLATMENNDSLESSVAGVVAYTYHCPPYMYLICRYGEELKKARNEGIKKGFFTSVVLGTFYLVIFGVFALGFW